jgi:autotransporter-associated beta strand protein
LGTGAIGLDGALSNSSTAGVTNNAALVFNLAGSQTAAYSISGSGSVTKAGPGTLTLSGMNNFSGGTFVSDGELIVTNPAALSDGSSLIVGQGAIALGPIVTAPTIAAPSVAASAVAVPEPGSLLLAAAATLSGWALLRRKAA